MSSDENPPEKQSPLALRGMLLVLGALALLWALWAAHRHPLPSQPASPPAAAMPTRLAPQELSASEAVREADTVTGYRREIVRPNPVENLAAKAENAEAASPSPAPGGPASHRRDEKKTLPEVFRMPEAAFAVAEGARGPAAPTPTPSLLSGPFAPFGRLLKCALVQTIDSVTARSEPIVAMVTEDLDWNGAVIIPAGTEAFSYATPAAVLDAEGVGRLVDTGDWTLVLPANPSGINGRELALRGRAVDRRESQLGPRGEAEAWALDDGADGLVGYTLSTLDDREIRLFAAAALSGLTQGIAAVSERQESAVGLSGAFGATQVAPTLGNAAVSGLGAGGVAAANEFANRIREEINKRGVYVRVPAGKTFYLFVEQTIDPRRAEVGLRLPGSSRAAHEN